MVRSQTFEPVTSRDLNWSEYLTLCRWKLQHDCKPITRPRASWAQLLMTFRIRDPTSLVYRKADAGIIPASIDTPMQRIKLFDLGLLALHLGFKKVAIDVRKREFEAVGEFGTITTLLNNELGKVVHFEADILAVSSEISKGSLAIYIGAFNNAQGKFSFGDEFLTNGYNCPLHLVTRATSERWGKPRFELELENWELQALSQEEDSLSKGDVPLEASLFEELHNDWMRQVKADGPDRNNLNLTHRQDRGKGSPKPNQVSRNPESCGLHGPRLKLTWGRMRTTTNLSRNRYPRLPLVLALSVLAHCLKQATMTCPVFYQRSVFNPTTSCLPTYLGSSRQSTTSVSSTHPSADRSPRRFQQLADSDETKSPHYSPSHDNRLTGCLRSRCAGKNSYPALPSMDKSYLHRGRPNRRGSCYRI